MDISKDDGYIPMDTETVEDKNSIKSRASTCVKKFLLAIITAGLIAFLVFQIILISAGTELKVTKSSDVTDTTEITDPSTTDPVVEDTDPVVEDTDPVVEQTEEAAAENSAVVVETQPTEPSGISNIA